MTLTRNKQNIKNTGNKSSSAGVATSVTGNTLRYGALLLKSFVNFALGKVNLTFPENKLLSWGITLLRDHKPLTTE